MVRSDNRLIVVKLVIRHGRDIVGYECLKDNMNIFVTGAGVDLKSYIKKRLVKNAKLSRYLGKEIIRVSGGVKRVSIKEYCKER